MPDQTDYFAQHKNKAAPNFISQTDKAAGGRKNVIGPGPRPGKKQPPSATSDFLLKSEQQQTQERE